MKKNKNRIYIICGFVSLVLMIMLIALFLNIALGNKLIVGKMIINNKLNIISFLDTEDDIQTITITFKGSTENKKFEYLIELVDSSFDTNEFPVEFSFEFSGLGEEDVDYFTNRERKSSIYKILYDGENFNDKRLIYGVIPENTLNVDGKIIIKAKIKNEIKPSNLSFKINVDAKEGLWISEPAYRVIARNNEKDNCEFIKKAVNTNTFGGEGESIYYTGSEECVDSNYIWYSGKLWRIVALYPNGIMKLVTENPVTVIDFGEDVLFNKSYINDWLLQEFLPTLFNYEKVIVFNGLWDISLQNSSTENKIFIRRPIGLLNSFEYQMSVNDGDSYLNIGQYWWLSDPLDNKYVRSINDNGNIIGNLPSLSSLSVRPSIYLKSSVSFSNSNEDDVGKRENPYRLVDDNKIGVQGELISNRQVGEFVSINDKIYRIIGFEKNGLNVITKVVSTEYAENTNSSNVNKYLASFGEDISFKTDSTNEQYWDYFLKNSWLKDGTMLEEGNYYLGSYVSGSYLQTICKDENQKIDECVRIDNEKLLYRGLVGLLRVGEMFSAQQSFKEHTITADNYYPMWLITPYQDGTTSVRKINNNGMLGSTSLQGNFNAVRPTIYLKANAKIASGEGTMNNPYLLVI